MLLAPNGPVVVFRPRLRQKVFGYDDLVDERTGGFLAASKT